MEYVSGMTLDDRLETSFTRMVDATREDYAIIARHALGFTQGLPDRILRHLALLAGDTGGYAVDRLTHSLQTATRAQRDGRDEEYVVCALVHAQLPAAEAVQVQVEDGLPGIVARIAGEAVAGRFHSHLACDPGGYRDHPTEGRLVSRVGLSCRRQMLFGDDQEVEGRLPPRLVLRNVERDHEVVLVEQLRPNLAVDDLAEQALGHATPPD